MTSPFTKIRIAFFLCCIFDNTYAISLRGTNYKEEAALRSLSSNHFIDFVDANSTMNNSSTIPPTIEMSPNPTVTPSDVDAPSISYIPGQMTVLENGLVLSTGLTSKIIATSGQPISYSNGDHSEIPFHSYPDAAQIFPLPNGGWAYASNSENWAGYGGVGVIHFSPDGDLVDYKTILSETAMNCGGGGTPWNTWVSCEENFPDGQCWETDPTGVYPPNVTKLGGDGGNFESMAYDDRGDELHFFVTEDKYDGALRRFTPDKNVVTNGEYHEILTSDGTMEYLILEYENMTYFWTDDLALARENAIKNIPNAEGIDVFDGMLYFTTKYFKELITLDLDKMTWWYESTASGYFANQPDQVNRIVGDDGILYFCEDGGPLEAGHTGIHGRDGRGGYFTVAHSMEYYGETSGLAFSPDGKHMYFTLQTEGLLFDVTRLDGLPFNGRVLSILYHYYDPNVVGQNNATSSGLDGVIQHPDSNDFIDTRFDRNLGDTDL